MIEVQATSNQKEEPGASQDYPKSCTKNSSVLFLVRSAGYMNHQNRRSMFVFKYEQIAGLSVRVASVTVQAMTHWKSVATSLFQCGEYECFWSTRQDG